MFDFEKLEVYQVTKTQNIEVMRFIFQHTELNTDFSKSWKESSLATVLNLAESTARMTHAEKKHYLTIARGNINTCVALMELAKEMMGLGFGLVADEPELAYLGRLLQH